MEDKVRLKITSSWISTSKDYLEIVRLKKEIVETIKRCVDGLLGNDMKDLIEANSVNTECILDQEDIRLDFLDNFRKKYCPNVSKNVHRILPRYGSYNGRYIQVFDTYSVPEIRDLEIEFEEQCPRLFDTTIKSFDSLETIDRDIYNKLKEMLIQYLIVSNKLSNNVDVICRALSHKDMTKTILRKELPKLYKLC